MAQKATRKWRFWSSGRLCETKGTHALPGIVRIEMFVAQDPGLRSKDSHESCLGFLKTAEAYTGDGIRPHCSQSVRVVQAAVCFVMGNELGSHFVSLLIPMKVKQ